MAPYRDHGTPLFTFPIKTCVIPTIVTPSFTRFLKSSFFLRFYRLGYFTDHVRYHVPSSLCGPKIVKNACGRCGEANSGRGILSPKTYIRKHVFTALYSTLKSHHYSSASIGFPRSGSPTATLAGVVLDSGSRAHFLTSSTISLFYSFYRLG